jgi:hypothetical protein
MTNANTDIAGGHTSTVQNSGEASSLSTEENTPVFGGKFLKYVCPNDSIEVQVGKYTFSAVLDHDQDAHIDDDDVHNIDQTVTGCDDSGQAALLKARKAWSNDEWFYGSLSIEASYNGVRLGSHLACLGGIEVNYPGSDNAYLTQAANELLSEALVEATKLRMQMIEHLSE